MGLQDLPVETIARIFGFLEWRDLLVVSQLNNFFRDVYLSFPEVLYSFLLQTAGMVDSHEYFKSTYSNTGHEDRYISSPNSYSLVLSSGTGSDIRSKIEEIKRRERSWRMMDLSRSVTRVIVPHRTSHIYDLTGGIYLLGDCKHSVISRDTHTLRFFDLTTCGRDRNGNAVNGRRGEEGEEFDGRSAPSVRSDPWPEMKIEGCGIVDIGFALQEFDLVAVVCIKPGQHGEPSSIMLSFRELSTGAPHPLARVPDVVVDPVEDHQLLQGKLSIMLETVGPRLLLLLTWHRTLQRIHQRDQDKLLLFNWWEGTKVVSEVAPQQTWDGFVFLSPELVLLPNRERGLEIIRLPDVSKGYSAKGFERILCLTLPSLNPLIKIGAIQCRSEPNPIGQPHPSVVDPQGNWKENMKDFAVRIRAKRRPPVVADPEKAIVLLQMYYREFNNEPHDVFMGQWGVLRHNVSLVVHREFLLRLVGMFASARDESGEPASESPNASATNGVANAEPSMGSEEEAAPDDGQTASTLPTTHEDADPDPVPTITWAAWGKFARWMADDTHVSNWITTSAGQRYVGTDEEGRIVVKDFNPINVKKARAMVRRAANADMDVSGDEEDESDLRDVYENGYVSGENHNGGAHMGPKGWEDDGSRSRTGAFENTGMSIPGAFENTGPSEETQYMTIEDQDVDMDVDHDTETTSQSHPQPENTNGKQRQPLLSPSELEAIAEERSWARVRLIEGYNEVEGMELEQLFSEECKWPLECVEYVSKERYDYHGLLMDEERIIGLRHDEHTGAIVQFDVFTL